MPLAVVDLHRVAVVPVAGDENPAAVELYTTKYSSAHVKTSELGKAMGRRVIYFSAI